MTAVSGLFPYAATTHGITVRAAPSFCDQRSDIGRGFWFWSYHIRIENGADQPVQLLSRRWVIRDGHGETTVVSGDGVVGEQPLILPGMMYDYVSGCPLPTSSGRMGGRYGMHFADQSGALGPEVKIMIPDFKLMAPPG